MAGNVHSGHRERMRKRILEHGAKNLEDHELLEILLYYSIPQMNTNPIAHRIINEYGSLVNVLDADVHSLIKEGKLSERTAVLINLITEFVSRYYSRKWDDSKMTLLDIKVVGEYAKTLLNTEANECFYMFCLDSNGKLIKSEIVARGVVNETQINLRKVAELALKNNSSAVILAHNHPGGSLKPSNSDIDMTKHIAGMLTLVNVVVHDHIIVANNDFVSFKELGLMDDKNPTEENKKAAPNKTNKR